MAVRSHLGNRLVELDRVDSYLRALRQETHEALDAARLAIAALESALRSARLGGGRVNALLPLDAWLLQSIEPSLVRVRRVVSGLHQFVERLDDQIETLQREVRDLLMQHPGVLRPAN